MAQSFRSALRARILSSLAPGNEHELSQFVRVPNNSMLGYGEISGVYRHGKRGAAMCFDRFGNCYHLSELSEDQCKAILDAF